MGTLRIGTECSGICALSAALDRLQIDVDYAFACECDVHCQKQLRALAVPPKVIYENMETRDAASMPVVDLYVLGSPCQSYSYLGKRKGAEEMRGFLIFKGIEYIKLKLPNYFILENVNALACVFEKWYEGFCEATLRCAAVAGLISSSKRELLLKAVELLETRIKIFGDAFFEKAFADGDKRYSNLETIDEDEEKSGHK